MHISQNTTSTSYSTCDTSKNSLNCLNLSDLTAVADGGAATSVYSLLHSDTLSDTTRHALRSALLRYCELDTLAMVMVVQAFQGWLELSHKENNEWKLRNQDHDDREESRP